MDIQIILAVISSMTAISVAFIGGFLSRFSKKQEIKDKQLLERAKIRAQESILLLEMQKATMDLALCTAEKLFDLQVNGKLEKALNEAEKVNKEYEHYDMGIHAEHMVYGGI